MAAIVKRIDFHESSNRMAITLSMWGLYAKTISRHTGLSTAAIYYRCRKLGVRLTDYRKGRGLAAEYLVKHANEAAQRVQLERVLRPLLKERNR